MYIYISRKIEILSATFCWPKDAALELVSYVQVPYTCCKTNVESSQRCNFELKSKPRGSFHSLFWGANCFLGVYLVACFKCSSASSKLHRSFNWCGRCPQKFCVVCTLGVCVFCLVNKNYGCLVNLLRNKKNKDANTQLFSRCNMWLANVWKP